MDALSNLRLPTFAEAVGGDLYLWLEREKMFEQFMDRGFGEAQIDPRYLEAHAPRIYAGLSSIAKSANRSRYEVRQPRLDECEEDMESGLMHRDDDECKDQIHYFRGYREVLRAQGVPQDELATLAEFFRSSDELDRSAHEVYCALGARFDRHNESLAHANRYEGSLAMRFADGKHLLRMLDYLKRGAVAVSERPDAKVHVDRSGATLHFESTHPGLVVWDRNGKPHRMQETKRNTVLLFPSRKMAHVVHWLGTPGAAHGVLDPARNSRADENRKALVAFPHCTLTPAEVASLKERLRRYKPDPAAYPFPEDMRPAA